MNERIECAHLEVVPLHELKPHPDNTNEHPRAQIELLAEIIKYNGQRNPIVVSNRSGFITKGHGRLMALQELAWEHAGVDYQDYESEAHELADMQADNRIAELAEQDENKFQDIVLKKLPDDFDLQLLGSYDLKRIEIEKVPGCDEDDVPAIPEVPTTKRGDMYRLGDHSLLCGDSTFIDDVDRLMGGVKADMVFTDPPYNHASHAKGVAASVRLAHRRLMESEWDKNFDIKTSLGSIDSSKAENCTVYICTSYHLAGDIWKWSEAANQSGWVVWIKPNPMPSLMKRHWTWDKEMICYSTYGKHIFNFPSSGHAPSSWHFQKNRINDLHPTMKPVEVPEHAIIHSSNKGQNILDLFGGSGSTLIACEKTNRKCFMMEIDPHYCDVIIERFQKYSNKKAYLINNDGTKTAYDDLKTTHAEVSSK